MDERLGAGRHHLTNGDRALHLGYLDESRAHFEAALLQFRGPELRLGEAHAMRGMAQVELGCGNLQLAEETARGALDGYRGLRDSLQYLAPESPSSELWREMETGEAGTLVLLGDLLTRVGRLQEARAVLEEAAAVLDHLGGAALGAVQAARGRLALREGHLDDARLEFQRSLLSYELATDVVGQCTVHVARGELERLRGDLPAAELALVRALELAKRSLQPGLQGRALAAWAGLLVQLRRLRDAREAYQQALPLIRAAGDTEIEGFALLGLGEILSRDGEPEATATLVEGAQLVGRLGHVHGLAGGMLRLAQHALFLRDPELALAAADSARQLFRATDPIRGVGQALRLEVKALGQLKEWPATVAAAHLRASLAGATQPNALEVQAFYRARAPQPWLDELDRWTHDQLEARAIGLIDQVLGPVLAQMGLDPPALGTLGGAVAVVGTFHRAMTGIEELTEIEPDFGEDLDELPSDALEEIPPEDLPEGPIGGENLAAPPRRRSVLTPIQAPERTSAPSTPIPESS
jgi:tetratricopeptide (TPR) repeat protein